MLLYQCAQNLVHTEFLMNKLITETPYPNSVNGIHIEQNSNQQKQMTDLTAHRMFLLTSMATALGYKLVKDDGQFLRGEYGNCT